MKNFCWNINITLIIAGFLLCVCTDFKVENSESDLWAIYEIKSFFEKAREKKNEL